VETLDTRMGTTGMVALGVSTDPHVDRVEIAEEGCAVGVHQSLRQGWECPRS